MTAHFAIWKKKSQIITRFQISSKLWDLIIYYFSGMWDIIKNLRIVVLNVYPSYCVGSAVCWLLLRLKRHRSKFPFITHQSVLNWLKKKKRNSPGGWKNNTYYYHFQRLIETIKPNPQSFLIHLQFYGRWVHQPPLITNFTTIRRI